MNDDDLDYAQIAADQDFARRIAAGEPLEVDDTAEVPDLPPPGAPVMVVRPIRLPFEADQAIQEIARRRGVTPSALLRDWILAELEAHHTVEEDPMVALGIIQAGLQRVVNKLRAQQQHQDRDAA
jgi:hypothetical protein